MPRVTISESGKTPQPYRFKLERKEINIGRGSDNDIVVSCASASTHHSVIKRIEGGYILRDAGSTNGIKMNDTLMEVIDLYDGMEVLVGDTPLKFQLSKEELEEISKEEYTSQQKKKLPKRPANDQAPPRKPERSDAPLPRTYPPMASAAPGMNPFLVIILMAAAVFGGMILRHYKDHQKLIFSEPVVSEEKAEPAEDSEPKAPAE